MSVVLQFRTIRNSTVAINDQWLLLKPELLWLLIYIYIYIYQNNAAPRPHIDTCIMQYIVLTPLPPTPPTSTYQNHPTPPHTEINQVPRRFRKIRGKKTVLDHESININSEYLEKNLSEQGTEVTTNSNTAGRRVLSPLFQWTGAEVSFYLNYWEIEKTV